MSIRVHSWLLSLIALFLTSSCAYHPDKPGKFNNPTIVGRADALSADDLQHIIRIARHRMNVLMVYVPIRTISVVNDARVDVFFHLPTKRGQQWLRLERSYGGWRIAEEHFSG